MRGWPSVVTRPQRGRLLAEKARENRKRFTGVNKMASRRFATQNDEKISKLLTEKDSKHIKKSTKAYRTVSEDYLRQKEGNFPLKTALKLAGITKLFYAELAGILKLFQATKQYGNLFLLSFQLLNILNKYSLSYDIEIINATTSAFGP